MRLFWAASWCDLCDLAAVILKREIHGALKLNLSAFDLDIIDSFLHSLGGGGDQEEEGEAKKPHLLQGLDAACLERSDALCC